MLARPKRNLCANSCEIHNLIKFSFPFAVFFRCSLHFSFTQALALLCIFHAEHINIYVTFRWYYIRYICLLILCLHDYHSVENLTRYTHNYICAVLILLPFRRQISGRVKCFKRKYAGKMFFAI